MENGVLASIICDFRGNSLDSSLRIVGDKGSLYTNNFILPHLYHYLDVSTFPEPDSASSSSKVTIRTEKQYGTSFTTYHYQLQAFVAAVQQNAPFISTGADGVKNMRAIEMIYDAAGLPRRGAANPIA